MSVEYELLTLELAIKALYDRVREREAHNRAKIAFLQQTLTGAHVRGQEQAYDLMAKRMRTLFSGLIDFE